MELGHMWSSGIWSLGIRSLGNSGSGIWSSGVWGSGKWSSGVWGSGICRELFDFSQLAHETQTDQYYLASTHVLLWVYGVDL